MIELPADIRDFVKPMFGKACCRKEISGEPAPRSLCLGFGNEDSRNPSAFSCEWEIGAYYCGWRVFRGAELVCESADAAKPQGVISESIKRIEFGRITSLEQRDEYEIRLRFDTGITLDFLSGAVGYREAVVEIHRAQDRRFAEFSAGRGWAIGDSDLRKPGG